MYAVKEDHVRVVRELLLAGADPTTRNKVLWCFVHLYLYHAAYSTCVYSY